MKKSVYEFKGYKIIYPSELLIFTEEDNFTLVRYEDKLDIEIYVMIRIINNKPQIELLHNVICILNDYELEIKYFYEDEDYEEDDEKISNNELLKNQIIKFGEYEISIHNDLFATLSYDKKNLFLMKLDYVMGIVYKFYLDEEGTLYLNKKDDLYPYTIEGKKIKIGI